jgi:hypothetical protein
MAEDFIELGIEGIDKLVDKHFHKVPDKYVDKHTYHPHCRKRGRGERKVDEGRCSDSDCEVAKDPGQGESFQRQKMSRSPDTSGYEYGHIPPSSRRRGEDSQDVRAQRRDDPRFGPSYEHQRTNRSPDARAHRYEYSAPGGYGYGYSLPSRATLGLDSREGRGLQTREGPVKRSSSQPGRVRESGRGKEGVKKRRRRSVSDDRGNNKTKTGSGGGNGSGKIESVVLTLLGIAAGGLAGVAASGVLSAMDRKRENGAGGENRRAETHEKEIRGSRRDHQAGASRTKGGGRRWMVGMEGMEGFIFILIGDVIEASLSNKTKPWLCGWYEFHVQVLLGKGLLLL